MQPYRRKKILWGVLAFSPWILFFTVVPLLLFGFHYIPTMDRTGRLNSIGLTYVVGINMEVLFVLICYLIYVGKLKGMTNGKKWLWRVLMVFGHTFAIPTFWYLYIWKRRGNSIF